MLLSALAVHTVHTAVPTNVITVPLVIADTNEQISVIRLIVQLFVSLSVIIFVNRADKESVFAPCSDKQTNNGAKCNR